MFSIFFQYSLLFLPSREEVKEVRLVFACLVDVSVPCARLREHSDLAGHSRCSGHLYLEGGAVSWVAVGVHTHPQHGESRKGKGRG